MRRPRLLCLTLCITLFVSSSLAADWTQFRGPSGLATTVDSGLPTEWSLDDNLAWRTELPGSGASSPMVLGDRVYLTCYTGYGVSEEEPGDQDNLMRHVVCVARSNGHILWTQEIEPELPESEYQGNGARHGYSTSTPTTDGERLYVFFGKSGVFCFDFDGQLQWHATVGDKTTGWGSSTSPVLYNNLLIINAAVESGALVALDKATGTEVWRAEGIRRSWNTPLLVDAPDGGTELVVGIPDYLVGFDPATGLELWRAEAINDYVCPSVVAHDGIVYAIGGRKSQALAVRTGGRGDVTETHRLWRVDAGTNVPSPVYHEGHLYWVHQTRGSAHCLDAATGEMVNEARISPRPGNIYGSPILAEGRWYFNSIYEGAFVISATPELEVLAHNVFAEDDSRFNASPAVSDGQLFLRSDRYLYCVDAR